MAGLNAENLEQLRRWGAGLQQDAREEVAASGRAILLLIEEVERLHVLVWDRRLYGEAPPPPEPPAPRASELDGSLRMRLRRLRHRDDPQAEAPPDAVFHTDSTGSL